MGILKLPSGTWRVQVRRKSIKVDQTFPTELDAKTFLARLQAKVDPKATTPTLVNAWERYQRSLEYERKKERTRGTEAGRIKRFLEKYGDWPVGAIEPEHIRTYVADRLRAKPTPSPDAVRLEVAALSTLMNYCVEPERWIARNPCKGVPRPRAIPRVRRLSSAEQGSLITLLHHSNPRFRFAARLCLLVLMTGARPGEWLNTRLSDLNLKKGSVIFQNTKHNREPRSVPLTPAAMKLLDAQMFDRLTTNDGAFVDSDLLFPAVGDEGVIRPMHYTGALRDAKKKGLIPKSIKAHTGRHEYISTMVESSDLDDSRIMSIVGHHSPISMKVYSHLRNVRFADQLKAVDQKVLRPERIRSVAETMKLPPRVVEATLAAFRTRDEDHGYQDAGEELLYERSVIEVLELFSTVMAQGPNGRAEAMQRLQRGLAANKHALAAPPSEINLVDAMKTTQLAQTGEAIISALDTSAVPITTNRSSPSDANAPPTTRRTRAKKRSSEPRAGQ